MNGEIGIISTIYELHTLRSFKVNHKFVPITQIDKAADKNITQPLKLLKWALLSTSALSANRISKYSISIVYRCVSRSTNIIRRLVGRSLMNSKNYNGPRTEPCGPPRLTNTLLRHRILKPHTHGSIIKITTKPVEEHTPKKFLLKKTIKYFIYRYKIPSSNDTL